MKPPLKRYEKKETNGKAFRLLELAIWLKNCAVERLGINKDDGEIHENGLISAIIEVSKSMRKIRKNIFTNPLTKFNEISKVLPGFLTNIFEAYLWIDRLSNSQNIIDRNRYNIQALLTEVNIQLDNQSSEWTNSFITIFDLDKHFGGFPNTTWLDKLLENLNKNNPETNFHDAVILGVRGLTEYGLRSILRVSEDAPFGILLDRLTNGMDFYLEGDERQLGWQCGWQWWQGMPDPQLQNIWSFRILPNVEDIVSNSLGNGNGIIYSNLNTFGFNLFLLDVGIINNQMTDAYQYHISPFLNEIKQSLSDWVFRLQRDTGRYNIMMANNLDEPISRDFLLHIGLGEDEIEKIGYYTRLI